MCDQIISRAQRSEHRKQEKYLVIPEVDSPKSREVSPFIPESKDRSPIMEVRPLITDDLFTQTQPSVDLPDIPDLVQTVCPPLITDDPFTQKQPSFDLPGIADLVQTVFP